MKPRNALRYVFRLDLLPCHFGASAELTVSLDCLCTDFNWLAVWQRESGPCAEL